MAYLKETILTRIDEVLEQNKKVRLDSTAILNWNEEMFFNTLYGTIGILKVTYGDDSPVERTLLSLKDSYLKKLVSYRSRIVKDACFSMNAALENLKSEIKHGLLTTIENRTAGQIYGDMVSMAQALFDEGHKEPAAVLACGALEDSMKKFAVQNGLEVSDADLSQVVNALKSAGLLQGPQAGVVQSFVKLRNKAFHAEFEKIQMPEISSLIAFVQQFLIANFK